MSAVLEQPMSPAEFLAWEERQALRHEFDGVRVRAMTGGTAAHAAILRNLMYVLTGKLSGSPCQPFGTDLKIAVARGFRYPDAFVVCTPVLPDAMVVADPVVVFEVVSPSSVSVDFVIKNAEYRAIPSVRRYVVLQQDGAAATMFFRKGEDWISEPIAGDAALLRMPEIGIEIDLSDLYRGIPSGAEIKVGSSSQT